MRSLSSRSIFATVAFRTRTSTGRGVFELTRTKPSSSFVTEAVVGVQWKNVSALIEGLKAFPCAVVLGLIVAFDAESEVMNSLIAGRPRRGNGRRRESLDYQIERFVAIPARSGGCKVF
jgi:hypothetical protein